MIAIRSKINSNENTIARRIIHFRATRCSAIFSSVNKRAGKRDAHDTRTNAHIQMAIMYGANRLRPTLSPVRHEQRLFGITVCRDLIWKRCAHLARSRFTAEMNLCEKTTSLSPLRPSARANEQEGKERERGERAANADETINLPLTGSSDVKRMAVLPSFDINARHKFINLLTDAPAFMALDNRLLFRFRRRSRFERRFHK